MSASLKVILAATAIAALASPVLAQQSEPHRLAPAASAAHSHGSIVRTYRLERRPTYKDSCGYDMYAQCYQ
jgi:hypothetical protein